MPYTQAGLPYAPQSDTSHEAAVTAESFASIQRERVYQAIREWSFASMGRTQKELSATLQIDRASIAPRCHELEKAKRIEKIAGVKRDGCNAYQVSGYRGPR